MLYDIILTYMILYGYMISGGTKVPDGSEPYLIWWSICWFGDQGKQIWITCPSEINIQAHFPALASNVNGRTHFMELMCFATVFHFFFTTANSPLFFSQSLSWIDSRINCLRKLHYPCGWNTSLMKGVHSVVHPWALVSITAKFWWCS
jgi:hypothetical protein